eukprot:450805_1
MPWIDRGKLIIILNTAVTWPMQWENRVLTRKHVILDGSLSARTKHSTSTSKRPKVSRITSDPQCFLPVIDVSEPTETVSARFVSSQNLDRAANIKDIIKSVISRNLPAHSPLTSPKIDTNISSIGGTRLASPAMFTVGVRSGNLVCANRASADMGEPQSDRRPKRQTKYGGWRSRKAYNPDGNIWSEAARLLGASVDT